MNFSNKMGWMAFLIALSSLPANPTSAASIENNAPLTIENRLTRLSSSFKEKAAQLPENPQNLANEIALETTEGAANKGFANARGGGGGWRNSGGGGFGNARGGGGGFVNTGGGGGFVNSGSGWRNGWSDGGTFINRY